jgi:hypothetical protein
MMPLCLQTLDPQNRAILFPRPQKLLFPQTLQDNRYQAMMTILATAISTR